MRRAIVADREAVLALLEVQLREHHVEIDRGTLAQAIDGVLQDPRRGFFLVADRGAGPIGVAYVAFTWTLEHGGSVAWLEELYVVPELRGQGIGQALLERAMEEARAGGARAMDLEIESDHARVASLYQRAGFRALTRTRWQRSLLIHGG